MFVSRNYQKSGNNNSTSINEALTSMCKDFPGGAVIKNLLANLLPWVRKIPWSKKWQPTPVFLPGKIPRTKETGGLQSMRSQRVGHY